LVGNSAVYYMSKYDVLVMCDIFRISELLETRNNDNSITMGTLALLIQVQN